MWNNFQSNTSKFTWQRCLVVDVSDFVVFSWKLRSVHYIAVIGEIRLKPFCQGTHKHKQGVACVRTGFGAQSIDSTAQTQERPPALTFVLFEVWSVHRHTHGPLKKTRNGEQTGCLIALHVFLFFGLLRSVCRGAIGGNRKGQMGAFWRWAC